MTPPLLSTALAVAVASIASIAVADPTPADLLIKESEIRAMVNPSVSGQVVSDSVVTRAGVPIVDSEGEIVNGQLRFHIKPNSWNRLKLKNGRPLGAKGVAYYFSNIGWSAGRGWPTSIERCPRNDQLPDDMFPAATRHMLVVQFGGRVWVECTNSAANVGDQITDVFVGVNDQVSLYGDNTGTFDIVITGYSQ